MMTYFAVLHEEASSLLLLLADDDSEIHTLVTRPPWEKIEQERATQLYNDPQFAGLVVFLLDSRLALGHRTSRDAGDWASSVGLTNDPGGKRLLVILSGQPPRDARFHRCFAKSGKPSRDLEAILRLARRTVSGELAAGNWPHQIGDPLDCLSRAIHGLENVILPVRVDIQTLSDVPNGDPLVERIALAHFGPSAESGTGKTEERGYLLRTRAFDHALGIEGYVVRVLSDRETGESAAGLMSQLLSSLSDTEKPMGEIIAGVADGSKVEGDFAAELKLSEARRAAEVGQLSACDKLSAALTDVDKAFTTLIDVLRKARKHASEQECQGAGTK